MNKGKLLFFVIMGLALLLFAYGNHFENGFHFHDITAIEQNSALGATPSLHELLASAEIGNTDSQQQRYQPLVTATLIWDRFRGGLDPRAYHTTSFFLYLALLGGIWCLVGVLTRLAAFRESASPLTPLAATAVYAFSAVQAETVNYISARAAILGTLFTVASLILYFRGGPARAYKLYLVPAVLAVLCSIHVLALPLIIFTYVLLFVRERNEPLDRSCIRACIAALPSLMSCGAFFALVLAASHPHAWSYISSEILMWQPAAAMFYAFSFLYPFSISASPSFPTLEVEFTAMAGVIFVCALLTIAAACLRERNLRLIGFGVAWYLLSLLPPMFVTESSSTLLDYRDASFALIGIAVAITQGVATTWSRIVPANRRATLIRIIASFFCLAVLASHILMTRQRNRTWSSEETLWFDVIRQNPSDSRALMNYGVSKMRRGDHDIARIYFEEALRKSPAEPALHSYLGTLHGIISKEAPVAQSYFERSLQLDPERSESYLAYSRWLLTQGRTDEAISSAERAIELAPRDSSGYHLLLHTYEQLGKWSKIVEVAGKLLDIIPNDPEATRLLAEADERIERRRRSTPAASDNF